MENQNADRVTLKVKETHRDALKRHAIGRGALQGLVDEVLQAVVDRLDRGVAVDDLFAH